MYMILILIKSKNTLRAIFFLTLNFARNPMCVCTRLSAVLNLLVNMKKKTSTYICKYVFRHNV
jgi:hypothetical protein